MIPTSDTYRPFPALRRVGVGVRFGVVDVTAKPGAAFSASEEGVLPFGSRTLDDVYSPVAPFATLEPNLWRLDGTFEVLPDDASTAEVGWWSDSLSGEDGTFADPPWVRYDFASPISSIGWMLTFDDKAMQYPSRIRVTVYDASGAEMDDFEYICRSPVARIGREAVSYAAVKFTFLSTSVPFRRIRMEEADFGLIEELDGDRVGSVTLAAGADPIAAAFPAREVRFTMDNSDMVFDLFDPDGVYRYLQAGQTVDVDLRIGGESVYMGAFSFTSASVESTPITPTIQADDIVLRLDGELYGPGNDGITTLSAAVSAVLGDASVPLFYADGVADRAVRNSVPENTTKREALRMLAQAAMVSVFADRYGTIRFIPLDVGEPVGELTPDELYDYTGISISPPVDRVELTSAPIEGDNAVYTAGDGKQVSSFSNPCVAPSAGDAVAAWLLAGSNRRKRYSVRNRCDPAMDIGDTIRIHDIYKRAGAAVVTSYEITFGTGGLSALTGGVG